MRLPHGFEHLAFVLSTCSWSSGGYCSDRARKHYLTVVSGCCLRLSHQMSWNFLSQQKAKKLLSVSSRRRVGFLARIRFQQCGFNSKGSGCSLLVFMWCFQILPPFKFKWQQDLETPHKKTTFVVIFGRVYLRAQEELEARTTCVGKPWT